MKRIVAPIFTLLILALNLLSCDGLDENYSTNPSHRLSFSVDTLSFDTVFTTIGSATKEFMIYNRNDKPLMITDIMLAGGEETGFRINVDGHKGDYFHDIRIDANDSLFVMAEVTVNPNASNQPLLVDDSIIFTVNGINQTVCMEAFGQNVNLYKGGITLTKNTQLTADLPYLVYDSLVIGEGVKVNIAPGAIFYMHDKATIVNYGTIVADGTREKPIVIRGDRLDFILNDVLPYDRTPSQWGGIYFRPESFGNVMDFVIIKNGTTGLHFEQSSPEKSKLKLSNSQITNMGDNLFRAFNCNIEVTNTELTNAGGSVAALIGGTYSFIHCTLANYMKLAERKGPCLIMSDNANDVDYALEVTFENCIIDGSFSSGKNKYTGEIQLAIINEKESQYSFNHCVIKTKGDDNDHFKGVIFTDRSPSFRLLGGDKNKHCYDFRPDSLTTIGVGKANVFVTQKYPIDRYGVNRLTNDGPDIGAYEFVPKEDGKKNK